MNADQIAAALRLSQLACAGELEAARVELAQHPDLACQDIHCAAILGEDAAVSALLAADPSLAEKPGLRGCEPLLLLAHSHFGRETGPRSEGLLRAARELLDNGADVNAWLPDDELPGGRRTALACAAGIQNNRDLCKLLLEAGAEANDGASLFLAAAAEHWPCFEVLVQHGAERNATDALGRFAPLHWLLDVHCVGAAIERLLADGADPNLAVGVRRETALHVAVRRRREEWVEPLIAAGAAVDARTAGGMTAFRHAVRRGFDEMAEKLAECGADVTTSQSDALAIALQDEDLDGALAFIQHRPELLVGRPAEEARLLPDLAAAGRLEAVRLLLDAGMGIDARGLDDGSALHQAAWFGQPPVARLLIERGAALDLRGDDHDSTPLGWVAHGSRYSGGARERAALYAEIAEMLLAAGAPLPGPADGHDHPQLVQASSAVVEVLRRYGWTGPAERT